MKKNLIPLITTFLMLTACQYQHPVEHDETLDAQEAAYHECLQENMAVATAWEAIKQACREQMNEPLRLPPEQ